MTKYRQYFLEMFEKNRDLFVDFKEIHDKFVDDNATFKKEFNEKGKILVDIIREYELRLTSHQNKGQYGKFANNLSEKFWGEVRGYLPMIDFVGVK